MDHPTDLEKENILSQIIESPEFNGSTRYQELLQYLVNKSSKVTSLKEAEIAHEVFGKDSSFDPSTDPLIRSYISNLRKKLEHYYLTTENQFAYRLEIPKGQYLVKYSADAKHSVKKGKGAYSPILYLLMIGVLIALLLYRELGSRTPPPKAAHEPAPNPVWSEFWGRSDHPTLIVIGNYLFLSERGKIDRRTFLRVPQINSENELVEAARRDPNRFGHYEVSDVSYIGAGASLGVSQVINALGRSHSNISVKLSSELKWDDFDSHDIIYLGTLKTLGKLDTIFSRTNIRYTFQPNSLTIMNSQRDSSLTYDLDWRGGNYQTDYSIILKLQGSKNNLILFLTGFSEVGVMESIKSSTDSTVASRVIAFSKHDLNQTPFLFEMVSKAEGLNYTVFRSELKYFSLLPE
jgi:hypothetical protein